MLGGQNNQVWADAPNPQERAARRRKRQWEKAVKQAMEAFLQARGRIAIHDDKIVVSIALDNGEIIYWDIVRSGIDA